MSSEAVGAIVKAGAHTPGPWHIGTQPGPIVYGPRGEQVADLSADLLPLDEQHANMALINAAPDMRAALEAVNVYRMNGGTIEQARAVWEAVESALAKSRGE